MLIFILKRMVKVYFYFIFNIVVYIFLRIFEVRERKKLDNFGYSEYFWVFFEIFFNIGRNG